jgi:hypothetical protein
MGGGYPSANMVRAYVDNGTDTTGGTNIYTPESGKVFELKHMVVAFNAGSTDYTIDVYDDTNGTADQVMHIVHDASDTGTTNTYEFGPFEGFYFGKAMRVVASASSGVSIAVTGSIL